MILTSTPDIRLSRFIYGKDILERRIGLDIVTRREDEAGLIGCQGVDEVFSFHSDFLWCTKWQGMLIINATVEADLSAELSFQAGQVPIPTAPLQGVKNINAHFNERG